MAGKKTLIEFSSEKAYQFPCQASKSLSTMSFVNVKLNYVFYVYFLQKSFAINIDYTIVKAYILEKR